MDNLTYMEAVITVNEQLESDDFVSFYNGTDKDEFPVGILIETDKQLLKSKSQVVLLSRESLDAHKISHPEVGIDDYKIIPKILENGEVWQKPNETERIILICIGDVAYRAAIKTTSDGSKNYFLSLIRNTKQKAPKGAERIR